MVGHFNWGIIVDDGQSVSVLVSALVCRLV